MISNNQLELLSPAKNIEIAQQAILHGADAVYIGGPEFGARYNATNSIQDIAKLVEFARQYYAKVFVTFNTILHDNELPLAEKLIHQIYDAGADALIVQDLGILELDIPPIDLHASTQMDIRTSEKASFLSKVGFSQIVLARELNLQEINEISSQTDATIEYFIHGALCVAFSGQCYISHAQTGRSANRGDCSQACRLPYTLKDDQGRVVSYEKHLLSMKDNNQSNNLNELIDAGVRSFKIEGRYKDLSYVKNITAFYRQKLDAILNERTDLRAASSGRTSHAFIPNPDKTFHRGSTDYFAHGRKADIGAFDSPKFIGLEIGTLVEVKPKHLVVETNQPLTNGDGLNLLIKREIVGFRADKVEKLSSNRYKVFPNELDARLSSLRLPVAINRNLDHQWQQSLLKESSSRKISVAIKLYEKESYFVLKAQSEEGVISEIEIHDPLEIASQPEQAIEGLKKGLNKLGQTIYVASAIEIECQKIPFIPASQLNQYRRELMDKLTEARLANYPKKSRKPHVDEEVRYPESQLSFLANVYNQKARDFYYKHGVELIESAYEAHEVTNDAPLMITKHCLRFAFNLCPKQARGVTGVRTKVTPMKLIHNDEELTLKFNCKACEMQVWGKIKKQILKQSQPGSEIIFLDKS